MAIVSLRDQRITVYDAKGWILRAPVSSGQKGRETPAGIFSVIQKEEEHYSNLYDDAFMPHMQRITWSGIALHGGALPGYPASHGCVRMPYDFAARLFDATAMGMRVIVTPSDVAPVELIHPVSVPTEARCRRFGRRPYRRGARGGEESGPGEARRGDGRPRGHPGHGAGARGGKSEAQGRGAIGGRRDHAQLCHLGGGKGAGRGRQGAGGRQGRGAAGTIGCRQSGSAIQGRCGDVCA